VQGGEGKEGKPMVELGYEMGKEEEEERTEVILHIMSGSFFTRSEHYTREEPFI
jgi:hypothetical protein